MGGAVARVPPGCTAFGHRGAVAETWIIGCSGDEPVDPTVDWVRRVSDERAARHRGHVRQRARTMSARSATPTRTNLERLVVVKRRYDPDGVFAGNGIR